MSANKKINLEIKSDALRILKKEKNVTSAARIINAKYNLSVSPSTICRWKQKAAKIERNADVSKSHKKIFKMISPGQLDFEKVLYDELLISFGKGVRLYSDLIKRKASDLLKKPEFQSVNFNVSKRWLKGFNQVWVSIFNIGFLIHKTDFCKIMGVLRGTLTSKHH